MARATSDKPRATGHESRATPPVNPYARPASHPPYRRPLPDVEERPDLYAGVRFELQRGDDPPGMDVIGGSVWSLVYRCIYPHGTHDDCARYQRVIAAGRAEAVETLRRLMFGHAERIVLYDARRLRAATEGTEDTEKSCEEPQTN